jgi:ABC-2 type transport system permease protein
MKKQTNQDAAPRKRRFAKPAARADGGRVFYNGLFASGITVAVLAVVVLINLIVQALPSKYTEFDLSEAGLYTLSDSSVELTRTLEQDVTVYYLCETGSEDAIVTRLLDRYAAESSHLTWQQKDPAIYPTFAAQYDAKTASTGSLILVAENGRSTVIDASELYEYDYSNYYYTGSYDVQFDGEQQITSAIYRLTSGDESHAYAITNHGEAALSATLTSALEAQNIAVEEISLLNSTIPEDCDLLIINTPTNDFSAAGSLVDEVDQLRAYLQNGGKMLVLTDAGIDTPNLDAVLAEFGLERVEGLVLEGNSNYCLYGYNYYLMPDYSTPTESTALDGLDTSRPVLLRMAQGIRQSEVDDVLSEALLMTSDSAYSKAAGYEMTTTERADEDEEGPFALAVYAVNDDTNAEVIWVGCGYTDDESLSSAVPGNASFLLGCAASLTGQSSSILIASKALEADQLTIGSGTVSTLGMVFVILIPAVLLIAGAVITILRRRK